MFNWGLDGGQSSGKNKAPDIRVGYQVLLLPARMLSLPACLISRIPSGPQFAKGATWLFGRLTVTSLLASLLTQTDFWGGCGLRSSSRSQLILAELRT